MATGEVPFETAGQVEGKLEMFAKLFRFRYSAEDKWYATTSQKPENWYQVPVIHPWPPLGVQRGRPRYEDWDGGRKRRGGKYRNSGRGREFPPRDRGRDWYENPSHHGSWPHGRQSPRLDPYERPPPPYYRGQWDQTSPLPSPSHVYPHPRLSPPPAHQGTSPRRQGPSPSWKHENADEPEKVHRDKGSNVPFSVVQQDPCPPEVLPHPLETPRKDEEATEQPVKHRPPPLNLKEVAGFGDEDEPVVLSKSDVLDILNVASTGSNAVNCSNLKQAQKEAQSTTPTKPRPKKRHWSGSFVEEPPTTSHTHQSHTHQGHASHGARTKVDHGRLLDIGDHELEQAPLGKSELVKPSKPSPVQKKKAYHHPAPVSRETGIVAMDTKSKSINKGHKKLKRKAKRPMVNASSVLMGDRAKPSFKASRHVLDASSDENEEIDVITPPDTDRPLNVSVKKSLIQLSAAKVEAFTVSIKRDAVPGLTAMQGAAKLNTAEILQHFACESSDDTSSYHVEFDGTPTKMIFRTDDVINDVVRGVAREKKSKKKHKHKKHSKKTKSKHTSAQDTGQDTSGPCQDTTILELQDSGIGGQDTGKVSYNSDSLKVKIKL